MERNWIRPQIAQLSSTNPFKKWRTNTVTAPGIIQSKVTFKFRFDQNTESSGSVKTWGSLLNQNSDKKNNPSKESTFQNNLNFDKSRESRYLPVPDIFTMPVVNPLVTKPYSKR